MPVDPALAEQLSRVSRTAATTTVERDRLIRQAAEAGGSLREIARLTGLHHSSVAGIIAR